MPSIFTIHLHTGKSLLSINNQYFLKCTFKQNILGHKGFKTYVQMFI